MKVLQICHKTPYPLFDGGAYSLYHTALGLTYQKTAVKVFALNTPKNPVDAESLPAGFRENTRFESAWVDTRFKPPEAFINLFTRHSYFVSRFFSDEFNAGLIRILKKEEFDIVQLEHVYMGVYLDTIRKYSDSKVVLRPQNVENSVWKRYLEKRIPLLKKKFLQIAANRLRNFEIQIANRVDGIIAISPADEAAFHAFSPETPITTVPVGFDFSRVSRYDTQKQFDTFPVFYHLGSMDWLPNVQGLKWFITGVLPYILEDNPGFALRIAGKKMPGWFFRQQGPYLVVDQDINDSLAYQADKAVMIVPLLSGGGLRVKIVEGMALGKTIISTSVGAEGIPYADQENILIANTREEFSLQVKKCIDSVEFCRKIGANAQRLAMEQYDCRKTAGAMLKFYESLLAVGC